MNFNFPFILMVSTAFTGVAWLVAAALARAGVSLPENPLGWALGKCFELSRSFFPVLAVVFVLRSFLIEPFQIPSSSMYPTLHVGDFVAVNKFAYGLHLPVWRNELAAVGKPERGDIAVFFPPGDDRYFIKRVVGLPGDLIEYRGKRLRVNGRDIPCDNARDRPPWLEICDESLGEGKAHQVQANLANAEKDLTVRVKEGHYFMMGDNRDNSRDSRAWGQVPEERLVGRAFAIWMHWTDFFSIPQFSRNGFLD